MVTRPPTALNLVVVIAEAAGLISRLQSIPEPVKIAGRFRSTLGWIVPWNRILWYYYYDNEVMMMMQYYRLERQRGSMTSTNRRML